MSGERVVIIGAGVAGLATAHALAHAGYSPLVLECSGYLGGKLMSAEGYGGFPIEHGVHGWWKGYGNFFDLLRRVHGDNWDNDLFRGPYSTRFIARLGPGQVLSMRRPPPLEREPRLIPFLGAVAEMIRQGGLTRADAVSLTPLLARVIAFDHANDYAQWQDVTARAFCDNLGVTRPAQELVLANFTLACSFSRLDCISAAAFMSSANAYIFDAEASLCARWLRAHPATLIHEPLAADIEANGGALAMYTRAVGLESTNGRVDSVLVDRGQGGVIHAQDFRLTPVDLLDPANNGWETPLSQIETARALLQPLGRVWLGLLPGDPRPRPVAWAGDAAAPTSADDGRWLSVEWMDASLTRVRVLMPEYETVGTIDARDVPLEGFSELFAAAAPHTDPAKLADLRTRLAAETWRMAVHARALTQVSSLLLYVGSIDGQPRAYSGICTHSGGRLRYDPGLHAFACELHGSRFDCGGHRLCGPAEADLLEFRLAPSSREGHLDVQLPRFGRIKADHVVIATDVKALHHLLQSSPCLHGVPPVTDLLQLGSTSVTVVRLVLGRRVDDTLGLFHGFRTVDSLFNITRLQGVQLDRYRDRVHEVVELQLYRDGLAGLLSRSELLQRIKAELKEAYGWEEEPELLDPIHVATFRGAYSSFDPGSEAVRPAPTSPAPGLYYAGDWVQSDEGAWYMERAVRTGRLAARAILAADGASPDAVPLAPPVRTPWILRRMARAGRFGPLAVSLLLRLILRFHRAPTQTAAVS